LNSPAPHFKPGLWHRTIVFAASRSETVPSRRSRRGSLQNREYAVKRLWDDDELTTEWTLQPSDQPLLANKTGATRLGFAALLTFFRREGRFPAGKHEMPAAIVT